jgi:hypothetical protein
MAELVTFILTSWTSTNLNIVSSTNRNLMAPNNKDNKEEKRRGGLKATTNQKWFPTQAKGAPVGKEVIMFHARL